MLEGLPYRPVPLDGHVVGRHEAPDGVLWVVEEPRRYVTLSGREEVHEAAGDFARELLEQRSAVVGRHLVEDPGHLAVAQAPDQSLL